MRHAFLTALLISLGACAPTPESQIPVEPQDVFFAGLAGRCGNAFNGRLVSTDAVDADFGKQPMVMQIRSCSEDEIRIPFHVGDDHSRTWVITKEKNGLRLKHDHRHEDGNEDAVTQYGGDTAGEGTGSRQEFPVDEFSIALFEREGLTASVENTWAVELSEHVFAYELSRPNRFFRVEFDLTTPAETPPVPWGHE